MPSWAAAHEAAPADILSLDTPIIASTLKAYLIHLGGHGYGQSEIAATAGQQYKLGRPELVEAVEHANGDKTKLAAAMTAIQQQRANDVKLYLAHVDRMEARLPGTAAMIAGMINNLNAQAQAAIDTNSQTKTVNVEMHWQRVRFVVALVDHAIKYEVLCQMMKERNPDSDPDKYFSFEFMFDEGPDGKETDAWVHFQHQLTAFTRYLQHLEQRPDEMDPAVYEIILKLKQFDRPVRVAYGAPRAESLHRQLTALMAGVDMPEEVKDRLMWIVERYENEFMQKVLPEASAEVTYATNKEYFDRAAAELEESEQVLILQKLSTKISKLQADLSDLFLEFAKSTDESEKVEILAGIHKVWGQVNELRKQTQQQIQEHPELQEKIQESLDDNIE